MFSAGSPGQTVGTSTNLVDANDLVKFLGSCSMNAVNSPKIIPNDFSTTQGSAQPTLLNGSCDFGVWGDGSEQIKSLDSATRTWPPTRKSVTRSHSEGNTGSSPLMLTSQDLDLTSLVSTVTSSGRSAAIGSELKSQQHRGLSRTTSDPIPARGKSAKQTLAPSLSSPGESGQGQSDSPADRYKTELCRTFQDSGKCKYGDKCQFAHGKAELRSLLRHPKYKTDRCKTYHSTGFCPYGSRCHFVHDDNDLSAAAIAENEKRAEKLKLILEQQRQKQLQEQLLRQQQRQLQMAILQIEQSLQQLNNHPNLSSMGQVSPPGLESLCPNLLLTNPTSHKYADSLGSSVGTNSPPASLSDSPVPSPTLSLLDGEQAPVSGSFDYSNIIKQDLGEIFSNSTQLKADEGLRQSDLTKTNSQYVDGLNQFSSNYLSCLLQNKMLGARSEGLTMEDILRVTEVMKALPAANKSCNLFANPYDTSVNLSGLSADPTIEWSYYPQSHMVL